MKNLQKLLYACLLALATSNSINCSDMDGDVPMGFETESAPHPSLANISGKDLCNDEDLEFNENEGDCNSDADNKIASDNNSVAAALVIATAQTAQKLEQPQFFYNSSSTQPSFQQTTPRRSSRENVKRKELPKVGPKKVSSLAGTSAYQEAYDVQQSSEDEQANVFECPSCHKKIKGDRCNLAKHLLTHTQEPTPFKCPDCNKYCANNTDLLKHRTIHTGELSFKCRYCSKECNQAENLQSHMNRMHKKQKADEKDKEKKRKRNEKEEEDGEGKSQKPAKKPRKSKK